MPPPRFVNFKRYFSANQGGATADADKLAAKQRKAAEDAQKATQGLQQQFAAKAGVAGAADPVKPMALTSGPSTNVGNMATSPKAMAYQQAAPPPQATSIAQADANAQIGYGGPKELGDLDGTKAAYEQNLAAQQGLNQLGHEGGIQALNDEMNPGQTAGESRLNTALMGAAGRGKFDRLKNEFSLQKGWEEAEERAKALAAMGTEKATSEAARWAEEADRLRLKAGPQGPGRVLGYGANGESSGGDTRKNPVGAVRARVGDYETFASGTNNSLPEGNEWFKKNVSKKLWESLNESELAALVDAIAAAGGHRSADVDAQIAALIKKYGV